MRHTILHSVCTHRRHLRLDNLRTLILADNQFIRIQLATDDDGDISSCTEDEDLDKVIRSNVSFTRFYGKHSKFDS